MEQTGVMSEEAWSSLSEMYTSKEENELLTQLLNGFSCPNEVTYVSPFWSSDRETSRGNSSECLVSQESSTFSPDDGQSVLFQGTYLCPYTPGLLMSEASDISECSKLGGRSPTGDSADNLMELHYGFSQSDGNNAVVSDCVRGFSSGQYDMSASDCRRLEKQAMERHRKGDFPNAPESKKRSRNVADVSRSKKSLKSDKYQKIVQDKVVKNDNSNSIEEDAISEEITRGENHATKTSKGSRVSGKARKGASSDPQSLYARKRRERINERLRILQSLVPNGTKVDMSTMLEEAVNYVKFLQLQIKLLSSDETWMYAPLAYNGMDIGISNFDTTSFSLR
ncbi:unnamed protein product [Rhodiola kirilowii]